MTTDQDLMERVAAGEPDAFETLFDRYEPVVRRRLGGIVRDTTATEDLVQEVFLRIWTRADQWRPSGTVKGWLLSIATNLALNHLRSTKRRRTERLEAAGADEESLVPGWMVDDVSPRPDQVLEQAEQRDEMLDLLNALPDPQREAIRMVHEMEMTVQEAAERLEIPAGTVKSRLHYARRALSREWDGLRQQYE